MKWTYLGSPLTEPPADAFGFIYEIEYEDGTKYIGKKNFYAMAKLPALKSGEIRPGATRSYKTGSGKRVYFDIVKKETNWKKYAGSTSNSEGKVVTAKNILGFAQTKRYLTYLEVKYMLMFDVLEDKNYLNDNILGKFFKDNLI